MATDPLLSTVVDTFRLGADLVQRPEEFVVALRRLGYETDPSALIGDIPGAGEVAELMPLVEQHAAALGDGMTNDELIAALELLQPIANLVTAITAADFDLPMADPDDWAAVGADIAVRLPQMLMFDVVEYRAGWLVALLELLGLATRSRYEFESVRGAGHESVAMDFGGFGTLLSDPGAHFTALFLPGGVVDADRIGGALGLALRGIVSVRREPADAFYVADFLGGVRGDDPVHVTRISIDRPDAPPAIRGIELVVGPHRAGNDGNAPMDSLVVAVPRLDLDPAPIDLGPATIQVDVPAPTIGLGIAPDGSLDLIAALVGDVGVTLTVEADAGEPWRLFGADSGVRIELGGVTVGTAVDLAGSDIELSIGLQQLALRMDSEGADSFLANLVSGIAAELDIEITVSRTQGVRFDADPELRVELPTTLTLGPITLSRIAVEVGLDGGELSISFLVDTAATIGPLQVEVAGVGFGAHVRSGPNQSDFGLAIGLELPHRVAFAFEGSDAVSGGGFLDIDHDRGRYSGGAALKIVAVGVSALTVIDTKLPGDDDGWAFFASLGIDIPGIPLGFGFTLEGLGGLIALNRRLDAEALALGLRQGAVDAIMFPDDPVRDAAVLIPQIDVYFPIEVGNTVVGPLVELGWGSPVTLLTAQIGVVISLPQGLIAVMGSISMGLPTPDAPLIEINMDALGVIDLAAGSVTVAASLYDSRLLGVIELSGDMAFHVATTPQPYFALSIGGWHPAFQPPSLLPSVFSGLRRIRAEISVGSNVSISFESYLALTPNTVQFGGRFEIEASVKVITTYTARGWFSFDVLLVFSPFKLVADVTAGVGVYAGNKELMGVSLGVHVEGPEPWFASGFARFKFFGVKVKFDFTIGSKATGSLPPITDVLELIEAALLDAGSWEVVRPSGITAGIQLVERTGADADLPPAVLPDSNIVVRETIAPLERTLEKYGTNRIAQDRVEVGQVTVTNVADGSELAGVEVTAVDDWFAPAQFDEMTDAQRLAAPSYDLYQSGVSVGSDGIDVGTSVTVTLGHETKLWTDPADDDTPSDGATWKRIGRVRGVDVAGGWFDVAATAARTTGKPTVSTTRIDVEPVEYHRVAGQRVPKHVSVPS